MRPGRFREAAARPLPTAGAGGHRTASITTPGGGKHRLYLNFSKEEEGAGRVTAFDSTWQVINVAVGVGQEDGPLELVLTVGLGLPTPQGPVPIPLGVHRFLFTREQAQELFKKGLEEADKMPKKSDIVTATNLSAVEEAAQKLQQFRG